MKRRMITLVLFIGALTSGFAYGDNWVPGNPKPPIEDPWFAEFTTFFSEIWTFLVY